MHLKANATQVVAANLESTSLSPPIVRPVASDPAEPRSETVSEYDSSKAKPSVDDMVLTRLMRLNAGVSGLVLGLAAAIGIFVTTNWLVIKGGPVIGPHLSLLNQFLPGYRVTFWGSLVGAGYFFLGGFMLGYFVARTYNALAILRRGHE